jgi:hypothetical protein
MINLAQLYCNKKIILIGNGPSVLKYNIDFTKYDTSVGMNRVYLTPMFDNINVLYHSLSCKDWKNLEFLFNTLLYKKNFYGLIGSIWFMKEAKRVILKELITKYNLDEKFIYSKNISKKMCNSNYHLGPMKKRPLTGIAALNNIIEYCPKQIDIYGYDFYQNFQNIYGLRFYKRQTNLIHDLEENKIIFNKLIESTNGKINYFN